MLHHYKVKPLPEKEYKHKQSRYAPDMLSTPTRALVLAPSRRLTAAATPAPCPVTVQAIMLRIAAWLTLSPATQRYLPGIGTKMVRTKNLHVVRIATPEPPEPDLKTAAVKKRTKKGRPPFSSKVGYLL